MSEPFEDLLPEVVLLALEEVEELLLPVLLEPLFIVPIEREEEALLRPVPEDLAVEPFSALAEAEREAEVALLEVLEAFIPAADLREADPVADFADLEACERVEVVERPLAEAERDFDADGFEDLEAVLELREALPVERDDLPEFAEAERLEPERVELLLVVEPERLAVERVDLPVVDAPDLLAVERVDLPVLPVDDFARPEAEVLRLLDAVVREAAGFLVIVFVAIIDSFKKIDYSIIEMIGVHHPSERWPTPILYIPGNKATGLIVSRMDTPIYP